MSALLGTPDLEPDRLREIDIDRILPNSNQPRKTFNDSDLDDLADSIRTHGVVQPIVIRSLQDGVFQIVAGERRWRAAQRAGLMRIPALVREADEHQALELALVENVQRKDLNPIDQARAYERLLSEFGMIQEEVARRVSKSRASVANMLRLLKLPGEVQQWLMEGRLSVGHVKALLSLPRAEAIVKAAREIMKGGYTVRQAESLVAQLLMGKEAKAAAKAKGGGDPNVNAALVALERVLGTKVRIRQAAGRGKIEIHFHSQEELDRVYKGLLQARF